MIRISKKADYAIVVLSHLALAGQTATSARMIAEKYQFSYAMVANLLKALTAAGWVTSQRGIRGGYMIRRNPSDISLDELIEVVEGPYRFADCTCGEMGPCCPVEDLCPARDVVRRVHSQIREILKGVSVAELAGLPQDYKPRVLSAV